MQLIPVCFEETSSYYSVVFLCFFHWSVQFFSVFHWSQFISRFTGMDRNRPNKPDRRGLCGPCNAAVAGWRYFGAYY